MSTIRQSPIAVLGAGAWGTALALLLERNGNRVRLWSFSADQAILMREKKLNPDFLPGFSIPDSIQIYSDLADCLNEVSDILIVVPSEAFASVAQQVKNLTSQPMRIVWGTKGLDKATGKFLHQVISEIFGENTPAAVISGPSFSREVAMGLPTAVSISGNNSEFIHDLINRFHSENFRVYKNPDFIGVQICGVMKNVLSIAAGISDGLELGSNARSALITRGLAEMARLNVAIGGNAHTLMSLAGVGDLILTSTDNQSRNRRFGLALGQGKSIEEAKKEIGKVVEGLVNTQQVREIGKTLEIDMPITEQVYQVLYHNAPPSKVVSALLHREPKLE